MRTLRCFSRQLALSERPHSRRTRRVLARTSGRESGPKASAAMTSPMEPTKLPHKDTAFNKCVDATCPSEHSRASHISLW
jgi:hypothetical protein